MIRPLRRRHRWLVPLLLLALLAIAALSTPSSRNASRMERLPGSIRDGHSEQAR